MRREPGYISKENDMDIGPSFPELSALTEIESMLAARVHPLVQVWTVRTGQAAYVGHVVNLEQRVAKFFDNLPISPREVPILLIRRPTREEWSKKVRRTPLVVNRPRLEAAFRRLLLSHKEYKGDKTPRLDNLDKYYSDVDANGDVSIDVSEYESRGGGDAHACVDLFRAWIRNESFQCASALSAWLRGRTGHRADLDPWGAVRRELESAYSETSGKHPAAYARGATAVAASWLAGLLRYAGVDSDIPDCCPEDESWLECRISDEFAALEYSIAREEGGVFADCGGAPTESTDPRRDHALAERRVDELKALAESAGFPIGEEEDLDTDSEPNGDTGGPPGESGGARGPIKLRHLYAPGKIEHPPE